MKDLLDNIPPGYTLVTYQNRTYGLQRTDFNAGRSSKVYAEELGGTDFISFNYYRTAAGEYLKPCEMAEEKVRAFLAGFTVEEGG